MTVRCPCRALVVVSLYMLEHRAEFDLTFGLFAPFFAFHAFLWVRGAYPIERHYFDFDALAFWQISPWHALDYVVRDPHDAPPLWLE